MSAAALAPRIHPTAIVDPSATLDAGVVVGPYCIVDGPVTLGADVVLDAHVVVSGDTRLGPRCRVHAFAALGQPPQDVKYKGEPTSLIVGADTVIREHVTMHRATTSRGRTVIGERGYFMVGSHIAHDCLIGDRVTFANGAVLGGHVEIGDDVIVGGLAAIHQFTRVGRQAFIGGMATVVGDVIPFGSVVGNHARLAGLNLVGLKRRGFPRPVINALRAAFRILSRDERPFEERLDLVSEQFAEVAEVREIIAFARADAKRALCPPRRSGSGRIDEPQ